MSELIAFLIGGFIALVLITITCRLNDKRPELVDMDPEPLGDMVDVSKINGWHDDEPKVDLKQWEGRN
jgi:hypothetical protein